MIELYRFFIKLNWKAFAVAAVVCAIGCFTNFSNDIDFTIPRAEFLDFVSFVMLASGFYFYNSFAGIAPKEMGVDTLALLPVDRLELGYLRYLLPLTIQGSILLATIFMNLFILQGAGMVLIVSTLLHSLFLGIILLSLNYIVSNMSEEFREKTGRFKAINIVAVFIIAANDWHVPEFSITRLLIIGLIAASLVFIDLYTFQKNREFRIS